MAYATLDQVSKVLDLTPRRINQLAKEGLPRESRGEYDLVKCVRWYIAHLRKQLADARHGTETEVQGRARLVSITADLRAIDLAERRAEMIRIDDAQNIMDPVFIAMRMKLLAFPKKVGSILGNTENARQILILLNEAIRENLNDLATVPEQLEELARKKSRRSESDRSDPVANEIVFTPLKRYRARKDGEPTSPMEEPSDPG